MFFFSTSFFFYILSVELSLTLENVTPDVVTLAIVLPLISSQHFSYLANLISVSSGRMSGRIGGVTWKERKRGCGGEKGAHTPVMTPDGRGD